MVVNGTVVFILRQGLIRVLNICVFVLYCCGLNAVLMIPNPEIGLRPSYSPPYQNTKKNSVVCMARRCAVQKGATKGVIL